MNVYPFSQNSQDLVEENYRNHKLVSRTENGKCVGEVFKGRVRIAYCESVGMTSSLQHLRSIVDNAIVEKNQERKNAIPSQEDWVNAIMATLPDLSDELKAMLTYLVSQDNQRVELEKLRELSNSSAMTNVYLMFAELARRLCDEIAYEPPIPICGRDPFVAMVLETERDFEIQQNGITLVLTSDFFAALKSINWQKEKEKDGY